MKNVKILTCIFLLIAFIMLLGTKVIASENSVKMYIDCQTGYEISNKQFRIRGWVMSKNTNITINAYIDDQKIATIKRNESRPDVLTAIEGYGTIKENPKPGFNITVDVSDIKDGNHTLKIVVIDNITKETLQTDSQSFNLKKYSAKMYIDEQTGFEIDKEQIRIRGWVMSQTANIEIKAYIDNKEVATITRNESRPDVLTAIEGYGTIKENPRPGFNILVDAANMLDGNHTYKIIVTNKLTGEQIESISQSFNLKKYSAKMYIDEQTGFETDKEQIRIRGWVMSQTANIEIKAYIDNKEVATIIRNELRPDVLAAIQGYGSSEQNQKPGFNILVDAANMLDGNHTLKIIATNTKTNEQISTISQTFNLKKYSATMYIDNQTKYIANSKQIRIRGWAMSQTANIEIKAYIDNKEIATITRNESRPDVLAAIQGYGTAKENPIPGFDLTIDAKDIKNGNHTLKITVTNTKTLEMLESKTANIKIENTTKKGIDVSVYQGNIDWSKVAKDGVDFAMIRAGYRGYGISSDGIDGKLVKDSCYEANIKGALNNKIEVGVYFFTQAINEKEAIEEANYVLNLVKGYNITYPIAIDTEDVPNAVGRADNLTKEQRTKVVKAFCETIEKAGYEPMIYANKWWLKDNLDMSQLSNYSIWLAHYTGATQDDPLAKPSDYDGKYIMWQYTDKGVVDGIIGNVDMNVEYARNINKQIQVIY